MEKVRGSGTWPKSWTHLHGHFAAVTAAPAQLAVVPITPGPDGVVIRETQGLRITRTAGHVNHTVALQRLHLQRGGIWAERAAEEGLQA